MHKLMDSNKKRGPLDFTVSLKEEEGIITNIIFFFSNFFKIKNKKSKGIYKQSSIIEHKKVESNDVNGS